jgi:membrane protein
VPAAAAGPVKAAADKVPVEKRVRGAHGALLPALLRRFIDADLASQSAALAFSAILSLAPLLILLLWFTQTLLPSGQQALLDQIALLAGDEGRRVAGAILDAARRTPDPRSIAGWGSIALLLVGASAVFAQLQDVLNRIFRTEADRLPGLRAWLRKRVFSFGLLLAVGFLLLVSLTVNTALQLAFARVDWMLPVLAQLAGFLVYTLAFALMYHYVPDRSVRWRMAALGGAMTAAMFAVGRYAIALYLERANPASAYGSMGTLALAMVWIYYAGLVVFLGALITAVLDERRTARTGSHARGRAGG